MELVRLIVPVVIAERLLVPFPDTDPLPEIVEVREADMLRVGVGVVATDLVPGPDPEVVVEAVMDAVARVDRDLVGDTLTDGVAETDPVPDTDALAEGLARVEADGDGLGEADRVELCVRVRGAVLVWLALIVPDAVPFLLAAGGTDIVGDADTDREVAGLRVDMGQVVAVLVGSPTDAVDVADARIVAVSRMLRVSVGEAVGVLDFVGVRVPVRLCATLDVPRAEADAVLEFTPERVMLPEADAERVATCVRVSVPDALGVLDAPMEPVVEPVLGCVGDTFPEGLVEGLDDDVLLMGGE